MPNDTRFAVLYKKLVDHTFEAEPERLARTRNDLIAQLSACRPPTQAERLWTKAKKSDTINLAAETGETEK